MCKSVMLHAASEKIDFVLALPVSLCCVGVLTLSFMNSATDSLTCDCPEIIFAAGLV